MEIKKGRFRARQDRIYGYSPPSMADPIAKHVEVLFGPCGARQKMLSQRSGGSATADDLVVCTHHILYLGILAEGHLNTWNCRTLVRASFNDHTF